MATAQYDTRTRTAEETVVVLTLTEDEADELRHVVGAADGTRTMVHIFGALGKPAQPASLEAAGEKTYTPTVFTYGGVTYEMGAVYRDKEGDHFKFETPLSLTDNTPRGRIGNREGSSFGGPRWTLAEVASDFGPLTKVTL
ncbi:phiSA1p31-related protein [Streptomyces sp. NPDC088554]|uniref:phiSA1p31-related protein n=1 Tax=Streptomyces sp. NPDC088554 TaxID=3365865 RepID=UPI0037FC623C